MAKSEITRPEDRPRPLDLFSTMRSEMNRMLERFEHDWPRLPGFFGRGSAGSMVPELDVREDGKQLTMACSPSRASASKSARRRPITTI